MSAAYGGSINIVHMKKSPTRKASRARHSHRHFASLCRRRGGARVHSRRGGAGTNAADDQPSGETARRARRGAVVQEGRPLRIVAHWGSLLRLRKALAAAT